MEEVNTNIETLYDTYFEDVYNYLLFFTGNSTEAEDLTQDTFIKVINAYDSFKHKSSIKTWILGVAKHTAIDYFRKKKMINLIPNILSNIFISEEGDPDKEVSNREDWEVLQKALFTLKPDYRNVIIFRGIKEYSVKESAEILGWKESKVKVDYHRALKRLKNHLSKTGEGVVIFNEE